MSKVIHLSELELMLASDFAKRLAYAKEPENHHQVDSYKRFKRYLNGTLGEMALEKYLGLQSIVDWTIGDSTYYHKADLRGIGIHSVGVKTVEWGKCPIIHKSPREHQVIMEIIRLDKIKMCGLATIDVLQEYQDDGLVLDQRLKDRGTKTAFYGFHKLKPFANVDELRKLVSDYERSKSER